ncbi:alpha/beta hydrolase [Calycomorphotria hydatis]|uniref:Carboxylesterase NlhH n=1 Tax=Calycomorphotria hydatis TaxID=2528027 RepID=A0A517T3C6_9PLAN|nr:alpha/beta hydrolase [Calycomorphotria hydatis]QDT62887.1 Carboxylesterase NlhH [Calycomorphotria hydatis]
MNVTQANSARLWCSVLSVVLLSASSAWSEERILKDIAYDDANKAQMVDVYLVDTEEPAPVMVYIHGGGWHAGTKSRVPQYLKKAHEEGWLAIVSVEYRFTDVAVHPAQVDDCTRAIQFVRANAKKWNIDPNRIGVTGGSAGGHLSAYMTLQDEHANPDSDDPVEQQSSRVAFGMPFAGPTDWSLLSKINHKHPGYLQLIGYKPGTPVSELDAERMKDVSPISFASEDDPPVLIIHGNADVVVPFEHGQELEAALKKAGVPVELYVVEGGNHSVAAGIREGAARADTYMRKHFGHTADAPANTDSKTP